MPRSLPPLLHCLLSAEETRFQESTLQGYRAVWRDLLGWLDPFYREQLAEIGPRRTEKDLDLEALDPEELYQKEDIRLPTPGDIAGYLTENADLAWSTLTTRRQAIRLVYDRLGGEDPFEHSEVADVWRRIREEKRREPSRPERRRLQERELGPTGIIEEGPDFLPDHLGERATRDLKYLQETKVLSEELTTEARKIIPDPAFDLSVLRDRALLLLVGTTEEPREALVEIDLEDIYPPEGKERPTGIVMYGPSGEPTGLLRLETGPTLKYCPNRAVAAWILAAELTEGPLFRSFTPHGALRDNRIRPQTINRAVKRRAEEAGFDPAEWSTRRLRKT